MEIVWQTLGAIREAGQDATESTYHLGMAVILRLLAKKEGGEKVQKHALHYIWWMSVRTKEEGDKWLPSKTLEIGHKYTWSADIILQKMQA